MNVIINPAQLPDIFIQSDAIFCYLLILRSLKTAYDPFIYWLNRVKIVQMAFGSVNRLLQTSGSLLMNEQTSSLI